MDLSFATAVSGMQTVMKRQDIAADNIANVNTPGFRQYNAGQSEVSPAGVRISNISRTPNSDPGSSNTDLATQEVAMLQNKNELAANVGVVKTQDKMLGALLDIVA